MLCHEIDGVMRMASMLRNKGERAHSRGGGNSGWRRRRRHGRQLHRRRPVAPFLDVLLSAEVERGARGASNEQLDRARGAEGRWID